MSEWLSRDMEELLELLNKWGVEYFVVGGARLDYFVQVEPEDTKDLDIWVNPNPANATRVFSAFAEYTAPITAIDEAAFADPKSVLMIGVAPNRVGIRKSLSGLDFDTCWKSRMIYTLAEATTNVLRLEDLVAAKIAAVRPLESHDIAKLRKALALEERRRQAREGSE